MSMLSTLRHHLQSLCLRIRHKLARSSSQAEKKTRPNRRRSPMGASLCRLRPSLKSCRDRSSPIIFPCECEVLNVDFYKSSMVQPECHRFDPNPPLLWLGLTPRWYMDVWKFCSPKSIGQSSCSLSSLSSNCHLGVYVFLCEMSHG